MLQRATGEKKELIGSQARPVNGLPAMSRLYRFGDFHLDPRRRTLCRADSPVFLTPKAFDLLVFLLQNPNRLVTKEELLQAIWGDTFVEEGSLTQYVSHLRKALGDNADDARWIVTIARKGYQFAGDVIVSDEANHGGQLAGQAPGTESKRGMPYPAPTFQR